MFGYFSASDDVWRSVFVPCCDGREFSEMPVTRVASAAVFLHYFNDMGARPEQFHSRGRQWTIFKEVYNNDN
jgi:hypothetical protein